MMDPLRLLVVCIAVMLPLPVFAHGDWGHVQVTGWAIENLPHGELHELFGDPEVFGAALFGASFPDSGYWPGDAASREYAEYTHWEPFVQESIEKIRADYPPPFDTLEKRKLVAFLMGCAAHGMQDEIFDSLFLFQVDEHDDGGQDEADTGTDFFLFDDGHVRLGVEEFLPMDFLLGLYRDLPQSITAEVVRNGVDTQYAIWLNTTTSPQIAAANVGFYRNRIPWSAEHYLDPAVPGSLLSEVTPTMQYMEAIWERLHGRWNPDDLVIHAFPEAPRRLRSHLDDTVDGWATLVLGRAIAIDSAAGELRDESGAPIDARLTGTRWGHPYPRLVRFLPQEELEPGGRYTATLLPAIEVIGGGITESASNFTFQVECTDDEGSCRDLGDLPVPVIDGSFVPPAATAEGEDDGCAVAAPAGSPALSLLVTGALLLLVAGRGKAGGVGGGSGGRREAVP